MRVYLLRHGIAEDGSATGRDADRALSVEGVQQLQQACGVYRRLIEPGVRIIASPLRRAQETAALLRESLGADGDIGRSDALLPETGADRAVALLQGEMLGGTAAVALVGHQPHLGDLFGLLLTGSEQRSMPLKKGQLIGLEIDAAPTMRARLLFALNQKQAIALA